MAFGACADSPIEFSPFLLNLSSIFSQFVRNIHARRNSYLEEYVPCAAIVPLKGNISKMYNIEPISTSRIPLLLFNAS